MVSIETAVMFVFVMIVAGLIFWLLFWLVGYVGLPEPFAKVARVGLAILAVFVIISILLGLIGHPIFVWR